jgi:dTDP-glucose 4,6-dehydratase
MRKLDNLLVTGGCGFIGSAFIRWTLVRELQARIVNLDKMTYAANPHNLDGFHEHPRYRFIQGDINNQDLVEKICLEHEIDAIVHFAAESHVDRSIASPMPFLEANIAGTLSLLEVCRKFPRIHFHHISTDEVYGSLGESGFFNEQSQYRPNSPYSASKAASDHLVRAYAQSYDLSTTLSHCSNNYGPGQNAEKFIPLLITNCLEGKPLPVYGRGDNVRDWIYVDDHVEAVSAILKRGIKGEVYDIGGNCELSNLELLHVVLKILAENTGGDLEQYRSLIRFIDDRPGHDFRYAIDSTKIFRFLHWKPNTTLLDGLQKTILYFCKKKFFSPEKLNRC